MLMKVKHPLKNDSMFQNFADLKSEFKKVKNSKNQNFYEVISNEFINIVGNNETHKAQLMCEILESTQNKSFTEFMEQLKQCTELIELYESAIDIIADKYNYIDKSLIIKCCEIKYAFDIYVGFLMELTLKDTLEQYGFIVECNSLFDGAYKTDMLVGHRNSLEMVAIQMKSKTYVGISNDKKQLHIDGMNRFKNQYKTIKGLEHMNKPHTKFVFYNEHYHYCCYNGKSLVECEDVKNIKALDSEVNYFGYYGLKYVDTIHIVVEIANILGVEAPKTYEVVDLPIELQIS